MITEQGTKDQCPKEPGYHHPKDRGQGQQQAHGKRFLQVGRRFAQGVPLRTRIGVNSGEVVGGTVGDDVRLGYTVHGDAVNLAQRLEQANKRTGTLILVSARTSELVGDRMTLHPMGEVQPPGRSGLVSVYTPDNGLTSKDAYANRPCNNIANS